MSLGRIIVFNMEHFWNEMKDELAENIYNHFRDTFNNWIIIHGYDDQKLQENSREFLEHAVESASKLLLDSEEIKNKLIKEIETLYKEFHNLCKDLCMNFEEVEFLPNDPLERIRNTLKNKVDELKEIVSQRLEQLEELKAKIHSVCQMLKEDEVSYESGIPSVLYLNQLSQYADALEFKKEKFDEEMKEKCKTVVEILERLDLLPVHALDFFCLDTSSVTLPYNIDTLKELEARIEELRLQENDMKAEADHLRETLSIILTRINEPNENRERVLSQCRGHSKRTIRKLKSELQRCEEMKKRNLKHYISTIKEELADWWNRCKFSDEEKNTFLPHKETDVSDEILSLVELELERVKKFYKKYEKMFCFIERRKELWESLLQLEAASKNSMRLLSRDGNRGGILLKEEQERKKIQKELPKIEEFLKKKLDEFEREENRPFTIFGEDFRVVIERDHEAFHAKKEFPKRTASTDSNMAGSGRKRKLPDEPRSLEYLDRRNKMQKSPCCSTETPRNVLKSLNSQGPAHSSPKTPYLTPYYQHI